MLILMVLSSDKLNYITYKFEQFSSFIQIPTISILPKIISLSMSLNLNDQQVLEVVQHLYKAMQAEEAQKLIDLDHLDTFKRKAIKPLYPHKFIKSSNGYQKLAKFECGEICCDLSSGSTCCGCCCRIKPPDHVHQQFGLGANIYFNFMNHFTYCFLILSIFSIIALGIAYWITLQNQINPISNYQVFLFSTTMGSFSSNYMKCRYASKKQFGLGWKADFEFGCPVGQIHEFGPVITDNSEQSLTNCKYEREKYLGNSTDYLIPTNKYTITRDSQCTQKSCKTSVTFAFGYEPSTSIIAFPYACVDANYSLFNNVNIEVRVLTYIFVGIDLFISLGFLFFLCSQKQGEDSEIDFFKQFQLTLKDFSVKLAGFNSKTFDKEFHELIQTLSIKYSDFSDHIIQIKTPDDQEYLQMTENRRSKYQKLFDFMQLNFFDNMINPVQYPNAQSFINNTFPSEINYFDFKRQLIDLLVQYRDSRHPLQSKDRDMSIYLVLNSSSDISMLKKMRKTFCCDSYLVTKSGGKYTVEEAPIPDMLQWHNKTKWTFMRVIFSWIITIVIVVASYVLFGWIQWEQKRLLSQYNFQIDCGLFYKSSVDYLTFSTGLYNAAPAQYTHCYCSSYYFSLNITTQASNHCQAWWRNYLLYLVIPIIISVGLVIYNLIVSIIFKKLTQCQGHFLVTNEMFSYILKRSFILIMNMGLIIVLLNFNYRKDLTPKELLFLFQGQFRDITSDWYITIGSIIIMTMIFNILFPFMELFMISVVKCLRKCIDKRCWCRKTSQKYKEDFISLYSGDVYPIEERYALVISIFWITMLFNCVIPALNVIAALSFLLLKLVDKVLVFKFFKTPINFDESLHRKFMKILYISMVFHLAASAFLLSEPNLVPRGSNFSGLSALSSSSERLNTLIQTYYIIPYVGLCLLLIVYAVFKQTIIGLLQKCNRKIQRASTYKMQNSQSFLQSLSQFQLQKLRTMIQKQVIRLQNLKHQKQRMQSQNFNQTEYSELHIYPNLTTNRQTQASSEINTQITIYRKTYEAVIKHIQYHQQGAVSRKAKLVGMPGYEMVGGDVEAEKDKKMLELDSVLEQIVVRRSK